MQNQKLTKRKAPSTAFKKGPDPRRNLNGRPKRKSMTAHLEEAVTDDARKKIVIAQREKAKRGDLDSAKFIFDRLEGKPTEKHEVSGPDGEPIKLRWDADADA